MVLLQASQQEVGKDGTFGLAFLIICKMVQVYGKRAVFKGTWKQKVSLERVFDPFIAIEKLIKGLITKNIC